jgi:hypothetical protein
VPCVVQRAPAILSLEFSLQCIRTTNVIYASFTCSRLDNRSLIKPAGGEVDICADLQTSSIPLHLLQCLVQEGFQSLLPQQVLDEFSFPPILVLGNYSAYLLSYLQARGKELHH